VKKLLSIAHGFFVARRRVAMTPLSSRTTNIFEVRR
jgi:hypothetical protein